MDLQYRLSNGNWVDCGERTEEFLSRCQTYNGPSAEPATGLPDLPWAHKSLVPRHWSRREATREEVLAALAAGEEIRNHNEDWYSSCRARPAPVVRPAPEMVRCDCGHECEKYLALSASLGSSCPDCYDRLSD